MSRIPSEKTSRAGLLLAASIVSLIAVSTFAGAQHQHSAPAKASGAKPAAAGQQNSCSTCLERGAVLDPAKFSTWDNPDVKKSYEAAKKYPDTMDRLHCFCECKESPREHHKTLLTCFASEHAAGCGICQHEALMAAKLKEQGASDEEVEITVEAVHKTDGHAPTAGRGN
ncbi:MAG: PCYCGC motif-containing (lipo)protein [Acidobacteriota bacterium]